MIPFWKVIFNAHFQIVALAHSPVTKRKRCFLENGVSSKMTIAWKQCIWKKNGVVQVSFRHQFSLSGSKPFSRYTQNFVVSEFLLNRFGTYFEHHSDQINSVTYCTQPLCLNPIQRFTFQLNFHHNPALKHTYHIV